MTDKMKFYGICLLFTALSWGGCNNNDPISEKQEEWPIGQNVYVAGFEEINKNSVARLWKNGKMETLAGSSNGILRSRTAIIRTVAYSVFVSGNDVYVVGWDVIVTGDKWTENGGEIMTGGDEVTTRARLWKNGETQPLDGGTYFEQAVAVFVSGNDVYVLGCESLDPNPSSGRWVYKYWKNGKAEVFAEGKEGGVFADGITPKGVSSIFVSEGDVYVVGGYENQAKLWRNGVAGNLDGGTFANSVFVSGSDVYVAGRSSSSAKLWKNGTEENLNKGTEAYSVYVSGNDVYVAGRYGFEAARLWKNGIVQPITDDKGAKAFFSVFVSGENVYTSGYMEMIEPAQGSSLSMRYLKATLWKNGKILNLHTEGKNDSRAMSIFVQ